MEDHQRSQRITPRRLSFILDDFLGAEGVRGNGTGTFENNNERPHTTLVEPNHPQAELNLLQNLEMSAGVTGNAGGDTPPVVSASVLNSILIGQQSLANMVTNLSTIVHSQKESGAKGQIEAAKEVGDDSPVTYKELRQLLQNKHSPPSTIFDLEPPLADAVTMVPYLSGYQPPTFRKFDGTESLKEHIMSFLNDLGIYRSNKNLRLKEFSKSLLGRAFTCGITTFAELMRKAADITDAMKRQGKRTKGFEDMFDVCAAEERERKKALKNSRSSRKMTTYNTNEAPPIPLSCLQTCQLVEEWLKDGTLRLKVKLGKVLLLEEERGEELHRRPLPNHSVNTIVPSTNGIRIEEVEEAYDEEKVLAGPTNLDPQFCHNRPLYVEATIEGIKVRRALVDNGSGVNIIPSYLFHKLRMPKSRIRKSDVTLSTFHREVVESLGRVHAVLEVGPIKIVNVFQVIDGDSSYHLLLGRPWIHLQQCVPSTLYQCVKSNFRGKEIEIPGVKAPFEASESHLIDASLFDEMAPPGSSQLKTERGILLRDINSCSEQGYTPHPVQAFKIPRAKNLAKIKKEYLPNGEQEHSVSPEVMAIMELREREQIKEAPEELQDLPKGQEEKMEKIDVGEGGERRPLFISAMLEGHEKKRLIKL
ncbi:Aspartic peptidase domain superfamily [Sesbania bispinosa]|nr:Aspartic peptidase domain superfamily [Sesbania bispinosa]